MIRKAYYNKDNGDILSLNGSMNLSDFDNIEKDNPDWGFIEIVIPLQQAVNMKVDLDTLELVPKSDTNSYIHFTPQTLN